MACITSSRRWLQVIKVAKQMSGRAFAVTTFQAGVEPEDWVAETSRAGGGLKVREKPRSGRVVFLRPFRAPAS